MRAYGGGFVFAHRYLRETLAGLDSLAVLAKRAASDSEALAQLVEATERAPDILVSLSKHQDDDVRRAAVEALGRFGDVQAIKPLIARLKDTSWVVRYTAARVIGVLGDARAVEPLIACLGDNLNVVRAAAEALVKIGAPAVEPLIERLHDGNWGVRDAAAQALRSIGTPEALAALEARRSRRQ
jgi:HEAT repeat protein